MNIIFGFGRARNRSISQMCTIILSLVFICKSRYSFSRVWCMLRVWGYEWDIWLLKRFTKFSFFAKDVIISIFHHCEIRICYLGRSRLSFTRTSMKWKIISVKMKIFSIRCGFCCHFCYLFLPMIKCDKICICAFMHPPTQMFRSYLIVQPSIMETKILKYRERVKQKYYYHLIWFISPWFRFHFISNFE